jgi:hypothetical protein
LSPSYGHEALTLNDRTIGLDKVIGAGIGRSIT